MAPSAHAPIAIASLASQHESSPGIPYESQLITLYIYTAMIAKQLLESSIAFSVGSKQADHIGNTPLLHESTASAAALLLHYYCRNMTSTSACFVKGVTFTVLVSPPGLGRSQSLRKPLLSPILPTWKSSEALNVMLHTTKHFNSLPVDRSS